ncbi:MAG: P-II family nitrogen regulator [Flavobacteriaceae bacterium]|nr:P-II family nitrogen regulator [Flavobacteriaceae bacterium]
MKKIEALIRKTQFEDVKNKLHEVGVNFFSHWDVTGIGNEKIGRVYRGVSYSTSAIERKMLSIIVNDEFLEPAIQAIIEAGGTGHVGDGKLFVLPVEEAYRIRTGEKGGETLN